MFHRFSVLPVEARRRQRPASLCGDVHDHGQSVRPRTNRHNTKRACERCRVHRIKCGEKKPCTQCVASKAECIVAYALPSAPHPKKNGHSPTIHEPLCVLPCCPYLETLKTYSFSRADSISNTYNGHDKETIPTPTVIPTTDDLSLPTDYTCRNQGVWASAATVTNIPITRSSILDKDFTTNTKAASTQYYAMTSHLLPQHPHDVFPLGHHDHITNVLSKEVRGYYLRVFRDDCHPFMPILNARDFEKLADGSLATVLDTNSSIRAIADMVIALSMQHVHATGLAGRVLGLSIYPGSASSIRRYYLAGLRILRSLPQLYEECNELQFAEPTMPCFHDYVPAQGQRIPRSVQFDWHHSSQSLYCKASPSTIEQSQRNGQDCSHAVMVDSIHFGHTVLITA